MELFSTPPNAPQSSSSVSSHDSNVGDLAPSRTSSSGTTEARTTQAASGPQLAGPIVPAACLACRSKHLKCDGQTPCSRCRGSQSECIYVASRRGYKGHKRGPTQNPHKRHASSSPDASSIDLSSVGSMPDSCPMLLGVTPMASTGFITPPVGPGSHAGPQSYSAALMNRMQLYRAPFANPIDAVQHGAPITPVKTIAERCFDSFYHHYHASHPFLLPREYLLRHIRDTGNGLEHLLAAVRYVGSLFVDAGAPVRRMYLDEAINLSFSPNTPKDGFTVQALLLLIVALDGSCEQEKARNLLADCEQMAIEIGLNTRQFAEANGRGNPILEESWRRTWWDLYVCDGMVAGVHRTTNFLLFDVVADVGLPCEEHEYLSGNIPPPMHLEDFDDRLFSGEDRPFSSFSYRVAAIRNLGRFMRCPPIMFPEDENLAKIESLLTNWRLHLPPEKRDSLNKSCLPDEMMFQAHFITTACTIMLHQPHSQLDSSPARAVNSCAPYQRVPSGDAFNTHTRHTITAACDISKMITHATPLTSHTHFFTCVITMSAIVHLSKWALYFIQDEEDLRQQIRLNIGALAKLSSIWKAASTAVGQVKGVASEIYRAKKAQQINPAFWVAFTQDEMISSLSADDAIMKEFDTMVTQGMSGP